MAGRLGRAGRPSGAGLLALLLCANACSCAQAGTAAVGAACTQDSDCASKACKLTCTTQTTISGATSLALGGAALLGAKSAWCATILCNGLNSCTPTAGAVPWGGGGLQVL